MLKWRNSENNSQKSYSPCLKVDLQMRELEWNFTPLNKMWQIKKFSKLAEDKNSIGVSHDITKIDIDVDIMFNGLVLPVQWKTKMKKNVLISPLF